MTSAMSLGEGQILNRVGEPFAANIALLGSYSRDIKFTQVRSNECRSSITGVSGCDSLYEGRLTFTVRQRSDGTYYLRVTGERSDELFYRILIKSSSSGGTVYNTFDFLPEFKGDSDPALTNDADAGLPSGNYGVIGGKIIEVEQELPVVRPPAPAAKPVEHPKRIATEVTAKAPATSHLQIKKVGEYADDIHALQKENGEIEEQIVLLEKHIGLLKEVIRLKSEAGPVAASAVSAPASTVPAPASTVPAPASAVIAPKSPVIVQASQSGDEAGLLTWILLGIVVVLSALVGWMFLKIRRLGAGGAVPPAVLQPTSLNEMKPLDLTQQFVRPKW